MIHWSMIPWSVTARPVGPVPAVEVGEQVDGLRQPRHPVLLEPDAGAQDQVLDLRARVEVRTVEVTAGDLQVLGVALRVRLAMQSHLLHEWARPDDRGGA